MANPAVKSHAKLFWLLLAALVLLSTIVWREAQRTRKIVIKPNPLPLLATQAADVPIAPTDHLAGSPGAPLTLVEFADLGSKDSLKIHKILYNFVTTHPKEARLVWKDLPGVHLFGGNAQSAHRAAWCAGEQKLFWEFLAATSTQEQKFSVNDMLNTITELKGDGAKWRSCLENGDAQKTIDESAALARTLGFNKAPALFINNKQLDLTQKVDLEPILNSLISP